MTLNRIPRIDIAPLIDQTASPQLRAQAITLIGQAAEEIGFITVTGHGITAEDFERVFGAYAQFFAQKIEDKLLVKTNEINRGYVPAKGEQVDPGANPDFKECFDIMWEAPESDPYVREKVPLYGPNQWPDNLPEMEPILLDYYDRACSVSAHILEALATVLDSPGFFADKFERPMAMLRANYYPPRPDNATDKDFGIAPHTDYGCLTLLAQNGVGGLEVQNGLGDWIKVAPQETDLVINVGEMLETWSGGRFKATSHRVIGSDQERMSLPLFYNPDFKTPIIPIGQDQNQVTNLTAGTYLDQRYSETYVHRQET